MGAGFQLDSWRWCLVAVVWLLGTVTVTFATAQAEPHFIGWLGEVDRAGGAKQHGMEVLSWDPRVFLFRKFLTDAEVDYLIEKAKPRITRSGVSNSETGAAEVSKVRTSSGMFYGRAENEVVKRIEERIADWTMLPVGNGEGIQVLKYEETQKYDSHHDYFSFEGRDDNGGNRMCTVLMYLTDVEEGGETVFPRVKAPPTQKAGEWSACAMKGLAVKPSKGDVVAFWSIRPDGTFDPRSLHGGCPVIKGEKWSATKWIHVGHFAMDGEAAVKVERVLHVPPPPPRPAHCKDGDKRCPMWAESGECESNPNYMVGSMISPGACLASCNRCDLAPPASR